MIPKIDTSDVRFRAGGDAKRKQVKGQDAVTRDGRPVWTVRLTATEISRNSSETIWVEVAGDEPKMTADDLVQVVGLVYTPWVNQAGKLVRAFRADAVLPADPADPAVRKAA